MAVSLERYRWSGVKHEREQNEREGIPSKNRDRSVSQSDRSPAASSSDTRAYSQERERELIYPTRVGQQPRTGGTTFEIAC